MIIRDRVYSEFTSAEIALGNCYYDDLCNAVAGDDFPMLDWFWVKDEGRVYFIEEALRLNYGA